MIKEPLHIAVLLTCFNRRDKTIKSLNSLFEAEQYYINFISQKLIISIYLTDDGCTDGTSEAVKSIVKGNSLEIIKSDGNAFWAGGMRLAWNAALNSGERFDYFLLLNDDTILKENCLEELFITDNYCKGKYGMPGVYSGFVSDPTNEKEITYGAKIYKNGIWSGAVNMTPTGAPQECSMPNANILLVSNHVCEKIGILSDCYIHGAADWDYGLRAIKAGLPVLTTANICGYCERDHDKSSEEAVKVKAMSLKERKKFIDRPNTRQYKDRLAFTWRYNKLKYLIIFASYYLNLFCPDLYYKIFTKRGH